jgi:clan AA aspartic protease
MTGYVDDAGRALLEIEILGDDQQSPRSIEVWIDTGFTGELVLPQSVVESLGLAPSGTIDGVLADGTQTVLTTYHCEIKWFGVQRSLEVIANSGSNPLLGVGLLLAKELRIDYTNLTLSLTTSKKNILQ